MADFPVFSDQSLPFLERYINNASPTGFESAGQQIWLDYLKPYLDEYEVDAYGSTYGIINPGTDYRVVIEAHADEISWFVNYISEEGFIYLVRNGGSDHQIAPSKRVNIHTEQGLVQAVFGWPAIHTRRGDKEQSPTLKNIFLDCGCNSKKEVEGLGVQVGDVVTYVDEFQLLNDRFFVGRALDNRVGGFMIAEVARLLKAHKVELPFTLYVVNSVQEEVGLRGAQMVAERIQPHVAIVTDVTHDTSTPMIEKTRHGDVKAGQGPSLTVGPAVHNNLLRLIMDTAQAQGIDYQREAASRSTGTDTDAFAYSNMGVPSSLISLPLRYMHTTVEMAHRSDVEGVIRLIFHTLEKIQRGQDFRYFK
jgi:putative aminopeptidase FrvX